MHPVWPLEFAEGLLKQKLYFFLLSATALFFTLLLFITHIVSLSITVKTFIYYIFVEAFICTLYPKTLPPVIKVLPHI